MSLVQQKSELESDFGFKYKHAADDEAEEADETNEINKRFYFEWLKWMTPEQYGEYLDRFTCLRVPTSKFERCFLYFRRYPKDFGVFEPIKVDSQNSLYQAVNLGQKSTGSSLDLNKPLIQLKTFENPYAKKQTDPKKQFNKVTQKIVEQLPHNRTMLVVSYDEKHSDDYIRSIFGLMGKIRRVVSGELKKSRQT